MSFHPHHFTAAAETLDGCYLCSSCDKPRTGPLAYCDDCEAVTDSYLFKGDDHTDYIASRFHEELDKWAASFAPVNLPRRLDAVAARRTVA